MSNVHDFWLRIVSPWQLTPFPEYPILQVHVNDPGIFIHVA
jgi:hypothetical protein